jgi:hypothetical protein
MWLEIFSFIKVIEAVIGFLFLAGLIVLSIHLDLKLNKIKKKK